MSEKTMPASKKDQLFKILQVLGSPNEDDKSFITDDNAFKYIR